MKRLGKSLCILLLTVYFLQSFTFLVPVQAEGDSGTTVSDALKRNNSDQEKKEQPAADQREGAAEGLTAWDYIKTLLAFVFVIGLLYGVLRFVNKKNRLYDRNRLMKNMGGISLGQNKSIQLVVIGERFYLIGVGEDIRLLKEVTDPTEIESFKSYYSDTESEVPSTMIHQFLQNLQNVLRKTSGEGEKQSEDFGQLFKERLEQVKADRARKIRQLTEKEKERDE